MNETERFIVPPRLNRRHVVFGYTVWELGALLALLILLLFTRRTVFAMVLAWTAVLCVRPPLSERNAASYLAMLFRYFRASQIYRLRECLNENE